MSSNLCTLSKITKAFLIFGNSCLEYQLVNLLLLLLLLLLFLLLLLLLLQFFIGFNIILILLLLYRPIICSLGQIKFDIIQNYQ